MLEEVIAGAGGNPNYVSMLARATEASNAKLLEATYLSSGPLDPIVREMVLLDALFLAESIDHANWEGLGQLCGQLPEGPARDALQQAVDEVLADEVEHLTWARDTRAQVTMLQLTFADKAGAAVHDLVGAVRGWFAESRDQDGEQVEPQDLASMTKDELYTIAQEEEIPGRSEMNKQELLKAVRKTR